MFICPDCKAEFNTEDAVRRHLSICWRAKHPGHKSKPAPRSNDVTTRQIDAATLDFFNSFKEKN